LAVAMIIQSKLASRVSRRLLTRINSSSLKPNLQQWLELATRREGGC
jgi:hypothetical protein